VILCDSIVTIIGLGSVRVEIYEVTVETNRPVLIVVDLIVTVKEDGTQEILLLNIFLIISLYEENAMSFFITSSGIFYDLVNQVIRRLDYQTSAVIHLKHDVTKMRHGFRALHFVDPADTFLSCVLAPYSSFGRSLSIIKTRSDDLDKIWEHSLWDKDSSEERVNSCECEVAFILIHRVEFPLVA